MSNNQMVLPPDVMLLPAIQLPFNVRSQIDYEEGDYAIVRPGARSYSKIVDAQFAELITQFRKPKSIAEAVVSYSWPRKIDPEEVLDGAHALLVQLMNSRLLVPADSDDAKRITASFQIGDVVDGFVIRRVVQVLDDSELYQVEGDDGRLGALKIVRGMDAQASALLIKREIALLQHLDGTTNPRLMASGEYAGRHYVVVEWVDGKSAATAAAELRQQSLSGDAAKSRAELLSLCCAIVDSYSHLHEQGIIHGDVHARNLLVEPSGAVRIIDYGLSRLHGVDGPLSLVTRGGVGFFFEPEYARACLEGTSVPLSSFMGEQYSVAALLYLLLTGAEYADFSYEQVRMLQQIVEDEPLPFYKRGAKPWPEVESILGKALSKDPTQRFASLRALGEALKQLANSDAMLTVTVTTHSAGEALLNEVLQRLDYAAPFFATGVTNAPSASVTYGAAGIAYALYRMAMVRQEARLLSLADLWCHKALRDMNQPTAFYHPRYEVLEELVGHTTPYHTASGIFHVQALIAHALGDNLAQEQATAAFIAASTQPCANLDLTLGRSGTLLACSLLLDISGERQTAVTASLRALGERTQQEIWQRLDALAPIQEQREIDYLGIAHGWAGMLYATLRWHLAAATPLPAMLPARLQQLATCAEAAQEGIHWPAILDKPIYMPGWCNGSAGHLYLWTAAHQVYAEPSYLDLAEEVALNVWKSADAMPTLCCGLAGRGYALLKMYKQSGDSQWLAGAEELAQRAACAIPSQRDLVNSLYKGEVGVATLVADLADPGRSCLPYFEEEGWRKA